MTLTTSESRRRWTMHVASTPLRLIARHRELTVVAGLIAAFTYFAVAAGNQGFLTHQATANYLQVGAEIGIIAAPTCLLLIAGEFDLSVGSMVGMGEIIFAYVVVFLHWPLASALAIALVFGLMVGLVNGLVLMATGLPSFIITLAGLFGLLGLSQGFGLTVMGSTSVTGIVPPISGDPLFVLFNGTFLGTIPAALFWWLGMTVAAWWLLEHTKFGNWIYATGGDRNAAQKAGVPIRRVKIALFAWTAMSAVIVAFLNAVQINQAAANDGQSLVFEIVTAVVIGGTLITGGEGSPIGTFVGALLFGVVSLGFFFTNIPAEWYDLFVGAMLMSAVLVNKYTASGLARAETAGQRRLTQKSERQRQ